MSIASLLQQIAHENVADASRTDIEITGERYGCGARDEREKRACSLFLWLLGPTTEQLATTCPCKADTDTDD